MNGEALRKEFILRYGPAEGMRIFSAVMPGILADFMKMITAGAGRTVSEEYILEDRKGTLRLTGRRLPDGQQKIEAEFL